MVSEISKRIDAIFHDFYAERVQEKFGQLIKYCDNFLTHLDLPNDSYCGDISCVKLRKCVVSYYLDVIKYKEYHFSNTDCSDPYSRKFAEHIHRNRYINSAKVAAFTTKWLLKSMPIMIIKTKRTLHDDRSDKIVDTANELLALNHSLYLMDIRAESISHDMVDELLYHLKYRSSDDRNLIALFSTLDAYAKKGGKP